MVNRRLSKNLYSLRPPSAIPWGGLHPCDRPPPHGIARPPSVPGQAGISGNLRREQGGTPNPPEQGYPPLKKMSGPTTPPHESLEYEDRPPTFSDSRAGTHHYSSQAPGESPAGRGPFPMEPVGGSINAHSDCIPPLPQWCVFAQSCLKEIVRGCPLRSKKMITTIVIPSRQQQHKFFRALCIRYGSLRYLGG